MTCKKQVVTIGGVAIGGDHPVAVQTMTRSKTSHYRTTLAQIRLAHQAGAKLVRIAIFDNDDLKVVKRICDRSPCPIIADIHYNYQFALQVLETGIKKIRLNPGNISDLAQWKEIITRAKKKKIAIRIGINGGSIDVDQESPIEQQLVNVAMKYCHLIEQFDYHQIVVSIKHSDPIITKKANQLLNEVCPYPIHLGVTEAGDEQQAIIKSSIGLSDLLTNKIGSTIRVSVNGNKAKSLVGEVQIAKKLLRSCDAKYPYHDLVACPLCGRNRYKTDRWVKFIEKRLANTDLPIKIVVMGCSVNIKETKDADLALWVKNNRYCTIITKQKQFDLPNHKVRSFLKKYFSLQLDQRIKY